MSADQKPRILCFSREPVQAREFFARLDDQCEVVCPDSIEDSLEILQTGGFSGLFLCGSEMISAGLLLQAGGILQQLRDGLALVGPNREVLWHNKRFQQLTGQVDTLTSRIFYECFGTHEILGPDFCPLNTAFGMGEAAQSTLRVGDKTYYDIEATPVFDGTSDEFAIARYLIVVVRDTTSEVLQKQKLNAIYQAGLELGDLTPQELLEMSVEERIELLKSKLLHFTQDLLEYDTVEIRLLDRKTRRLDPLLSAGMHEEAEERTLHALPRDNGVTGFVAATGKSYLCEDTTTDPLYILGASEARSSLTVPLMLHDEVLGTFNVESPRTQCFTENDLQFLELFAREIAVALNTLELLAVEKISSATESTKLILTEVGEPVDEILQDATWLLEQITSAEPEIRNRLKDILKHTRDIKLLIQNVGATIQPRTGVSIESSIRPKMQHKRVLVVDSENEVRKAAHQLLGRFGSNVETAHNAEECFLLARSTHYDAVIADIRLPDCNGCEVFEQLRQIDSNLPVILMTGYGYDPSHSLVKARQAGCTSVLFKPFRVDQLIAELEKVFTSPAELSEQSTT